MAELMFLVLVFISTIILFLLFRKECFSAVLRVSVLTRPWLLLFSQDAAKENKDTRKYHCQGEYIDGKTVSSKIVRVFRRRRRPPATTSRPLVAPASVQQPSRPLRLVVISDTHGYEDQFVNFCEQHQQTADFAKLPDADVLIHAGDFMGNASLNLDDFLAAQTHIPRKLVVMGNHDSKQYTFERSKAVYVRSRSIVTLEDGTVIDLRPYQKEKRFKEPPVAAGRCDVLVTHEPPHGILDKTYRGDRAGSKQLRRVLDESKTKPLVYICGHIHDSRGVVWHGFRDGEETVVVNASNANVGRATFLKYGPVVIELV